MQAIADNGSVFNAFGSVRLGWVLLEVLIALAVAAAIVWWTWPRKPRASEAERKAGAEKDEA